MFVQSIKLHPVLNIVQIPGNIAAMCHSAFLPRTQWAAGRDSLDFRCVVTSCIPSKYLYLLVFLLYNFYIIIIISVVVDKNIKIHYIITILIVFYCCCKTKNITSSILNLYIYFDYVSSFE